MVCFGQQIVPLMAKDYIKHVLVDEQFLRDFRLRISDPDQFIVQIGQCTQQSHFQIRLHERFELKLKDFFFYADYFIRALSQLHLRSSAFSSFQSTQTGVFPNWQPILGNQRLAAST